MDDLKPSSKGSPDVDLRYDPTSETMSHDSVFSSVAGGVVNSGNLANKWAPDGDHTQRSAPPDDLEGE